MKILFVCDSVLHTTTQLEVARLVLKKTDTPIEFLLTGDPARAIVKALSDTDVLKQAAVTFTDIQDLIEDPKDLVLDHGKLANNVARYLKELPISTACVGVSSDENAELYLAIAQQLSSKLDKDSLYLNDDYLFEETTHTKYLKSTTYATRATWWAATARSKQKLQSITPKRYVTAIGHPEIDKALTTTASHTTIAATREALGIADDSLLIVVSCIKDSNCDLELLDGLLKTLATGAYPNLQVRIGLHPAADLEHYVGRLTNKINQYQNTAAADKVKIIVPPSFTSTAKPKLDLRKIADQSQLCCVEILGAKAAEAADGVACFVPATLVNTKVALGGVSFCYSDKPSFLSTAKLISGKTNISLFFNTVNQLTPAATSKPLDKATLGVPATAATITMADALVAKSGAQNKSIKNLVIASAFTLVALYIGIALRSRASYYSAALRPH